jgi:hypothetical protein
VWHLRRACRDCEGNVSYAIKYADCEYCTRPTRWRNLSGEATCRPGKGCDVPKSTRVSTRAKALPIIPQGAEYDGLRMLWKRHVTECAQKQEPDMGLQCREAVW